MTSEIPNQMTGKTAIVTGGGSGIGRAGAMEFARLGANVVVSDIDIESAKATALAIEAAGARTGARAVSIRTDVSVDAEVAAMVDFAVASFGGLDFAFNNAGIAGPMADTVGYSEADFDRVIEINLKGVWLCMKHEIPSMLDRGAGSIVNTASIAGLVGGASAAYNASKHGVIGMTKQAALEYSARGVRVNAVCPSIILTPMIQGVFKAQPELEEEWMRNEPIGRFAPPEEVATAVAWLCSPGASYITGHALPVDGGWLAR
jgi:NAD(P)-dependent dehydrogenase (short-subunit alcohol dehydrogenase family)